MSGLSPERSRGRADDSYLTLLIAVSLHACKKSAAFRRSGDSGYFCSVFGLRPKR
jgi:hypothetical protein